MTGLEWGETMGGWRLAATLDRATFVVEQPVVATVVLQNTSAREQGFEVAAADADTILDCRRTDGAAVAATALGRGLDARRADRSRASVAAGQTLVREVSVSQRLDLTLPGTYTLTIAREIAAANGDRTLLTSRSVHFEVTL
ncbi:MAG: hypothetical protein JNK78_09040 [Planctomycetes bacterium]|nr:hypothetical protein [Planctomycetota bacterium]